MFENYKNYKITFYNKEVKLIIHLSLKLHNQDQTFYKCNPELH